MKYIDFFKHFSEEWKSPVFSIDDIKNAFPGFNNVQLSQWQDRGYIKKIRKKQYIFADRKIDLLLLSHDLKKSYISLEYALAYYNWIPESVYQITAVTSGRGEIIKTYETSISYTHIKKELFLGYYLTQSSVYKNRTFAIAWPEKALCDLIYLRKDLSEEDDFESLRLNIESFNHKRLSDYTKLVKSKAIRYRLNNLSNYIKENI